MVDVTILCGSAADMFVVVDGVRIARRGYPGTAQGGDLGFTCPAGKSLTTGAGTQSPSNTTASASVRGHQMLPWWGFQAFANILATARRNRRNDFSTRC